MGNSVWKHNRQPIRKEPLHSPPPLQVIPIVPQQQMPNSEFQFNRTNTPKPKDTETQSRPSFFDHNSLNDEQVSDRISEIWNYFDGSSYVVSPETSGNQFSRTARIFVSSTFVDMHSEREVLSKEVFPRLRSELCVPGGVSLVEVDLRWGVPKATASVDVLHACMTELQRCRSALPGGDARNAPFIIVLLGQRYGWIPCSDDLDEAAIEEYDWVPGCSVTHMEIVNGVLRRPTSGTSNPNALIMVRNPSALDRVPAELKRQLTEEGVFPKRQLTELKAKLKQSLPSAQFCSYDTNFTRCDGNRVLFDGLNGVDFSETVFRFLKKRIATEFGLNESDGSMKNVATTTESTAQEHFASAAVRFQVGRLEHLEVLKSYLTDGSHPNLTQTTNSKELIADESKNNERNDNTTASFLYVSGDRGLGKTTLLAMLYRQLKCDGEASDNRDCSVFYHSSEASAASSSCALLLERLLYFAETPLDTSNTSVDMRLSVKDLSATWSKVGSANLEKMNTNCFIIIDALDKLDTASNVDHLDWLPSRWPINVRCIVSCDSEHRPTQYRLESRSPLQLELESLSGDEQRLLAIRYLSEYGKRLSTDQLDALLRQSRSPDWLSLAVEELRLFGHFGRLDETIGALPAGFLQLLASVVHRLLGEDRNREQGMRRCEQALGFLACSRSRFGIAETDLIQLLSDKKEGNLEETSPLLVWSRTRTSIDSLIRIDTTSTVRLKNETVAKVICFESTMEAHVQAVQETLFGTSKSTAIQRHSELANYYDKHQVGADRECRILHQLIPYHYTLADRKSDAVAFLLKDKRAFSMTPIEKSQYFLDLKCNAMLTNTHRNNDDAAYVCTFCLNTQSARSRCVFCAQRSEHLARLCRRHATPTSMAACLLCAKMVPRNATVEHTLAAVARLCRWCKGVGPDHCCFVDVRR